ncbi:MAG: Na+ dependent nucleoside transporter, partial [Bacteroidales bacterium]|nr:Na+ dependent nucleoside transporter [Bacteroidales bacterium]
MSNLIPNKIPSELKYKFNLITLLRGMLGIFVILLITYLFTENRKAISWKVVGLGLLTQILLAIGILTMPLLQTFFEYGGKAFVKILDFTDAGSAFLFSAL